MQIESNHIIVTMTAIISITNGVKPDYNHCLGKYTIRKGCFCSGIISERAIFCKRTILHDYFILLYDGQ